MERRKSNLQWIELGFEKRLTYTTYNSPGLGLAKKKKPKLNKNTVEQHFYLILAHTCSALLKKKDLHS